MIVDTNLIKKFNIYYQYITSLKIKTIYKRIADIERSKNEVEKPINKL